MEVVSSFNLWFGLFLGLVSFATVVVAGYKLFKAPIEELKKIEALIISVLKTADATFEEYFKQQDELILGVEKATATSLRKQDEAILKIRDALKTIQPLIAETKAEMHELKTLMIQIKAKQDTQRI